MTLNYEEMFFFRGSKGRKLLGFIHYPGSSVRNTGVIYCHPFAEEKNMSHSVVVKTSRVFCNMGFPVFRFDLSGCGDSEGELNEVTINDWLEDISCALDVFYDKATVKNVGLWGLGLGAGLLMHYSFNKNTTPFMLLLAPVLDFNTYIKQFIRRKISTQIVGGTLSKSEPTISERMEKNGFVNVMGYPISNVLYKSFIDTPHLGEKFSPLSPTLFLSISQNEKPSFIIQQQFELISSKSNYLELEHIMAEPFWDRYWRWECPEVTDCCMNWILNKLK